MSVTDEQVRHVARLARLRLEEDEVERLTRELNGILAHVDALAGADVADADAVGGVAEGPAPLRDDAPGADPLHRTPSDMAPAWVDGFFTVPRLAALGGAPEDDA